MIALGTIFGMTEDEAAAALSTVPEEIIRRRSENRIMEGVWVVTDGTDPV
jgi:RNase P/RNase MRP subunit p30